MLNNQETTIGSTAYTDNLQILQQVSIGISAFDATETLLQATDSMDQWGAISKSPTSHL